MAAFHDDSDTLDAVTRIDDAFRRCEADGLTRDEIKKLVAPLICIFAEQHHEDVQYRVSLVRGGTRIACIHSEERVLVRGNPFVFKNGSGVLVDYLGDRAMLARSAEEIYRGCELYDVSRQRVSIRREASRLALLLEVPPAPDP
ncbi:MAG TPA: hypothetical protein VF883_11635 [Thermoanaerobaculia bacterium]